MILYLPLKGEYFDAIKAGTKQEEYRLVTPYWRRRLEDGFNGITGIELMRGYPAAGDKDRRLRLPWRGYTIKVIQHSHFGPDLVTVFAINVAASGREIAG
jgi:hypothetical protein